MLLVLTLALSAANTTPKVDPKVELIQKTEGVREAVAARKGKVVVKFWATWCDTCVRQFPEFVRTANRLPVKDVDVMTVSVDLRQGLKREVIPFLRKQHASFPAYLLDVEDPAPVMATLDKTWDPAHFRSSSGPMISPSSGMHIGTVRQGFFCSSVSVGSSSMRRFKSLHANSALSNAPVNAFCPASTRGSKRCLARR